MDQMGLTRGGFERYGKTTKRAAFLAEMNRVVPWAQLCALIEPHYPKAGRGRHPVGLERMLRIHFLQHWFNLSDPAVEEALYESNSMREFVGIDLGHERVPDETTVCKFRHLLERHDLGRQIFEQVGAQHAPWAQDFTQHRGRAYKYLSAMQREINRRRSKVRARVEHVIGVIKRIFGFAKVRYRGLAKNGNRLFVAAALANLFTVRRSLLDGLRA